MQVFYAEILSEAEENILERPDSNGITEGKYFYKFKFKAS